MNLEPRTEQTATPPTSSRLRTWLSDLEAAAQKRWRRHFGEPTPAGAQWLPFLLIGLIYLLGALAMLAQLAEFLDKPLAGGAGWNHADPAGLVADPVHAYITEHTVDIGVDAGTVFWTWCAAGVVFLLFALAGNVGARIGWTLYGAATALMVFAGTPDPGRPVATGLTVTFWAVLSMVAYRRVTTHADVHLPDAAVTIERTGR